jgi:hypothetical protein
MDPDPTNSYTVVTGDRVIHSPGQNDTPDSLSGGDTGDRSPLTELCQGTHDTTVSPDPPDNHQGTAAAPAPATRPAVAATTGAGVVEFFAALGDAWRLTETQRARLTPAVQVALDIGWAPQALASVTGANTTGVRNPCAVLAARLSSAELSALSVRSARPPWCGECDQVTRMLDYHGDAPRPCPKCKAPRPRKPNVAGWPAVGAFETAQSRAGR